MKFKIRNTLTKKTLVTLDVENKASLRDRLLTAWNIINNKDVTLDCEVTEVIK